VSGDRQLRSNFEPGTARWATRIAQWTALGLEDDDFTKPKIAVVNTSSSLSICYSHLDGISDQVQDAIREAGGVPFEVRTVAPSDFITAAGKQGRYILPARDLIVNDVELMVEGSQLDAMVCLGSCDKTVPAHIMAAVRLNIPTIVIPCGYQGCGVFRGKRADIDDVYESTGAVAAGALSTTEQGDLARAAITTPGVCAGLATANTMHVLAEALGMALPGSAPIAATSPRLRELAGVAGARIVTMAREHAPLPREIVTRASLRNAVIVDVAMGGSVNSVRHLAAIAAEAEIDMNIIETIAEVTATTPLVSLIRPNGTHEVTDLEAAGGARGLLVRLAPLLDRDTTSVTGQTLEEIIVEADSPDPTIIRPLTAPFSPHGGLQILYGNVAPNGSILKRASVNLARATHRGPARIFGSEYEAIDAIKRGLIQPDDVVVLRGMGPKGGPGTVLAAGLAAALHGAGLGETVAAITDGELSGLNHGLIVGQVMPEAADGGPLGEVREGDTIVIDPSSGALFVDEPDFASRPPSFVPPASAERGWLAQYGALVQPVERGATLHPSRGQQLTT
jgi:dihydroxy-acid dehydratase